MVVYFYDKGYVYIYFSSEIQYMIGYCSTAVTPFSAALPAVTEKTWTITYNYPKLVFHCNGVQVADVLLSNSACTRSDWKDYWERKPTQIEFDTYDSASDTYCFSSNPGKYNGVIDSGE